MLSEAEKVEYEQVDFFATFTWSFGALHFLELSGEKCSCYQRPMAVLLTVRTRL